MKKLVKLVVFLILLGLLLPVTNLIVKPDNSGSLSSLRPGDSAFEPVAHLLEAKCTGCHLPDAELPFYAGFPIASGILEGDIIEGLRFIDLKKAFGSASNPVSEPSLSKIEYVVEQGTMPPHRYLAMHWDAGLGGDDAQSVTEWIGAVRKAHYATEGVAPEFAAGAVQPVPKVEGVNPAMAILGDRLFHDTRLSGDGTISCATCHDLAKGGTDQLQFSKGIRDQVGGINSPTVYNAVFALRQFWDGRAADLKEQAGGPVTNPIEMDAKWPAVIAKLEQDQGYMTAFKALFSDGIRAENIQTAIAAFEQTLVTQNAKFDKYLRGDEAALNADEKEGYHLFKENGCATCHVGQALGGRSFEYMGLRNDYFSDRGAVKEPDQGRFNFTKDEGDRHKFKVPTLRNLSVTHPYFHDGSTLDMKEAVRTMAEYQSDVVLDDGEVDKIVAFLNTLNGEYKGTLLQ